MKKALPLSISSFEKMRGYNYVYVDKTEHAYNLINQQAGYTYVFLSRPRRFGKSLFVDMLKQIFLGKKELFKDLWIYTSDWSWQEHPVIHIDFSQFNKHSAAEFNEHMLLFLVHYGRQHDIDTSPYANIQGKFGLLLQELSKKAPVIILIDEYDKPILDNIHDIKKAEEIRDILKSFYEVIKTNDACVRFLFMTGVTKFSQMSVFSGLNNLKDISFDEKYADITGYTQKEFEVHFDDYIASTAQKLSVPPSSALQEIKKWYNGYRFSDATLTVYNPFSILNFFVEYKFSNYWFASGTPTFLMKLLKTQYYNLDDIAHETYTFDILNGFELEKLPLVAIMYQAGYLTILDHYPETRTYKLGYPNFEVDESFNKVIAVALSDTSVMTMSSMATKIYNALNTGDLDKFSTLVQTFMSRIPSQLIEEKEIYFNTIFHCILNLAANMVYSQINHFKRRPDTVVTIGDKTYIFELKLNKTAQEALEQINHKKYYEPYLNDSKNIYLVGVNFNTTNIIEVTHVSSIINPRN